MLHALRVPGHVYIYGLLEPFALQLRHIGQARDPNARFRGHSGHWQGRQDEWVYLNLLRLRRPSNTVLASVIGRMRNEPKRHRSATPAFLASVGTMNSAIPSHRYLTGNAGFTTETCCHQPRGLWTRPAMKREVTMFT